MPSQTLLDKGSTESELVKGKPQLCYNGLHFEADMNLTEKVSLGFTADNLFSGSDLISPSYGIKLSFRPATKYQKNDNQ